MTTPAWIGIALIVGTVGFAIYGAMRGAIRQVGSIAAFLVGYLVAQLFGARVASALAMPQFACYCVVFALGFAFTIMLARVLHLTVKVLLLGAFDRMLGAIIGAAKWLLLTSLLINLFIMCGAPAEPFSAKFTQWVTAFLPRLFGLANTYIG